MTLLIVTRQMIITENPNIFRDQKLPGLSIDGCPEFDFFHHNETFHFNSTIDFPHPHPSGERDENPIVSLNPPSLCKQSLIYLSEISYMWYPCVGCCLSVTLGLLFSLLLKRFDRSRGVNPDYLSPPALWLLTKFFPNHIANWIEVDGYPMLTSGVCSFTMSVRNTNCNLHTFNAIITD